MCWGASKVGEAAMNMVNSSLWIRSWGTQMTTAWAMGQRRITVLVQTYSQACGVSQVSATLGDVAGDMLCLRTRIGSQRRFQLACLLTG